MGRVSGCQRACAASLVRLAGSPSGPAPSAAAWVQADGARRAELLFTSATSTRNGRTRLATSSATTVHAVTYRWRETSPTRELSRDRNWDGSLSCRGSAGCEPETLRRPSVMSQVAYRRTAGKTWGLRVFEPQPQSCFQRIAARLWGLRAFEEQPDFSEDRSLARAAQCSLTAGIERDGTRPLSGPESFLALLRTGRTLGRHRSCRRWLH